MKANSPKKDMQQPDDLTTMNTGKQYWLSLRDKENTPAYRAILEREFPEGTLVAAGGIDRRTFLTLMGASLALAGLTSCRRPEEEIVPYVSKPEELTIGNALQYATSMPLGTEAHSLLVTAREGRPISIQGNPLDTATGSASTVWANASILNLYDPDRSQHVYAGMAQSPVATFLDTWSSLYATQKENGGESLALLCRPSASPTLDRLLGAFRTVFPSALVATWDPVSDTAILEGHRIAFGRPLRAQYDFTHADIILALDADPFGNDYDAFANARGFATRRQVDSADATMNRLYVVEPSLTQTAALADHRLRLEAGRIPGFAATLLDALAERGLPVPASLRTLNPADTMIDSRWINAVADDLLAHRGQSLVVAGRGQHASVHALVAVINHLLGNSGRSVQYVTQPHAHESDPDSLRTLTTAMNEGKVETLIILGGNPVFDAAVDLDFRSALSKVGVSIHAGLHRDETAHACTWHLPLRHYLEAWGDVSSLHGHFGVIQPLIEPLYKDGISDVELLALLTTGVLEKGHDIVRETWEGIIPGLPAHTWRGILHDGLFPRDIDVETPVPAIDAIATQLSADLFTPVALSRENMEVLFRLSPAVHDGRFANNGWLQEFPDPVTKLTWDNAALISQRTAGELELQDGDLVRLTIQGRETPMPVWVLPGQADYCVTLLLGYGRRHAGRVGTGCGFNSYRLRGTDNLYTARGLGIGPTFARHKLACVQDHHGLDVERMAREGVQERLPMIYREGTLEQYRTHPTFAKDLVVAPPLRSSWEHHDYSEGHQWGMSIDLNACIGCGSCTIACQSENNIPVVGKDQVLNGREMHWIRIDRYYTGDIDDPGVRVMPLACHHCEMAPCEQVCPVAATSHDEEGLNVMTYNRCIGTRYCSNNCPYKVRRFNFYNYTRDLPESVHMVQNPDVTVRFRGVMEKCTYCTQRITRGKIKAKIEGRQLADGDIRVACEDACPTQAIVFGDINDPDSRVSRHKRRDLDYTLLSEYNLRPRTTFLARLRNPNPALS
ncbi:MAG: TAT-variant-translocated molybdopterin oxidoreductase [Bacteroidetes bacterium]|nr:TAT-variant-translocated molybdopterin oxidoreductase [Bacteroidota bacterium]